MLIEGNFASKAIGGTRNPAGWVGPGTITLGEQSVTLDGAVRSSGLPSLFAILGLAIGIGLSLAIGLGTRHVAAIGLGGLFAGALLGARVARAKPRRVEIPWARTKKPKLDDNVLTFVSKAAPKGEVTFLVGEPSNVAALRERLAAAGVLPAA